MRFKSPFYRFKIIFAFAVFAPALNKKSEKIWELRGIVVSLQPNYYNTNKFKKLMKKLFTLIAVAFAAMGLNAQTWNFSTWEAKTFSETTTISGLTVAATSD